MPPKKRCPSLNRMPVIVEIFGNRVFAEGIKDLRMQASWIWGEPTCNDWYPYERKERRFETQRKGHVKTGRYWRNGASHQRNANGGQQTLGETPGTDSPSAFRKSTSISDLGASECARINVCGLKPPSF